MYTATHVLDTNGLICPEPLMMLHGVLRKAQVGESIYMMATDPSAERDVTKLCLHRGHLLESFTKNNDQLHFLIIKQ